MNEIRKLTNKKYFNVYYNCDNCKFLVEKENMEYCEIYEQFGWLISNFSKNCKNKKLKIIYE